MKNLMPVLLLFVLLAGGCVVPAATAPAGDSGAASAGPDDLLAEILSRGSIRISTDPNYAPQSFLDESGNFQGF